MPEVLAHRHEASDRSDARRRCSPACSRSSSRATWSRSSVVRATVPTIDGLISEPPMAVMTSADDHVGLGARARSTSGLPGRQARRGRSGNSRREKIAKQIDQAALEAVAIDHRAGEQRQEIEQRVEEAADEPVAGLRPEPDLLGEVAPPGRLAAVVGEALEQLEDVGDPELRVKPVRTSAAGWSVARSLLVTRMIHVARRPGAGFRNRCRLPSLFGAVAMIRRLSDGHVYLLASARRLNRG